MAVDPRRRSEGAPESEFARDVRRDLARSPKVLQPKYFYDALGSALFDAITRLPWYRIPGAEKGLLARHGAEVLSALAPPLSVIELGGGSGEKLSLLLEAAGPNRRPAHVHLIDISEAALDAARERLQRLPGVRVSGHLAGYEDGLAEVARARAGAGSRLVLFLGSNIGNFDPRGRARFLAGVRAALRPGDGLLLGADLVKPEAEIVLAYDDPLGVTAAFNKNLLARVNGELEGDFDLEAFAHRALWNRMRSRVEMHLVSRRAQTVRIPGAGLTVRFRKGETIWTESSYKFTPESVPALGERAGFRCLRRWMDADARFALVLFEAAALPVAPPDGERVRPLV